MAELRSSDGRAELEGKEGQDGVNYSEQSGGPRVHVESQVEEDENHLTMMQKLKERITNAENYMKGKKSSVKEDPHPELSYITPGSGEDKAGLSGSLQEGKQHGGVPVVALGHDDIPAEETRDVSSVLKDDNSGEAKTSVHEHPHVRTIVTVEGADEPTMIEKIRGKFFEVENQMKGKRTSETEDPHPELAYIMPTPQEHKPGYFAKADKGAQPAVQEAKKGVGSHELDPGYEDGSEGSIDLAPRFSEMATADAPKQTQMDEEAQAVTDDTQEKDQHATGGDEKHKKPGFFSRLAMKIVGKGQDS